MPRQDHHLHLTEEEWKFLLDGIDPPPKPPLRTLETLGREFPGQRRDIPCRVCGAKLILKDGKNGLFYGCETWKDTRCKGSCNANQETAAPLVPTHKAKASELRNDSIAEYQPVTLTMGITVPEAPSELDGWLTEPTSRKKLLKPKPDDLQNVQVELADQFNQLWVTGKMKRRDAYAWLAGALGLTRELNFGAFDMKTCQLAIKTVRRKLHPIDRFEIMDEFDSV